ncbi:MAG: hypothetical protein MUF24_06875 [Chitinophagaceae bacterium]|jgi:hypothetical protein|nr:hypothetical protein [Chitinophagaceae bacterium]
MKKVLKYKSPAKLVLWHLFFVAVVLQLCFSSLHAQTIYTWVADSDGSWTDADNWTPRGIPGADAIVRFNHDGEYKVQKVPAETRILGLVVEGEGTTYLSVDKPNTNIFIGDPGFDACVFTVVEKATLVLWGENSCEWFIEAGTAASVRGTLSLAGGEGKIANHAIVPLGAPGLVFEQTAVMKVGSQSTSYEGFPFGTFIPDEPLVYFKKGAKLVQTEGNNPFGPSDVTQQITFDKDADFIFDSDNPDIEPLFMNREYPNYIYASSLEREFYGRGNLSFHNISINKGSLSIRFQSGTSNTISISGNIQLRGENIDPLTPSLSFAPIGGSCRVNLNGSDTQYIKGGSALFVSGRVQLNAVAGSKVVLQSVIITERAAVTGGGELQVQDNAYFAFEDEAYISGAGRFALRNAGQLGIGSQHGISLSADSGNVRTTNRIFGQATYRYIGRKNQQTGTALINWNATAPMPTIIIATQNNATVSLNIARRLGRMVLESGNFNTNGFNLTLRGLTSGGVANGPQPGTLSSLGKGNILPDDKGGAIVFEGIGSVETNGKFNLGNITIVPGITGSVNFGTQGEPTITGALTLQTTAHPVVNPPLYAKNSTLIYALSSTTFNIGGEWKPNADAGRGVPWNVQVGLPNTTATRVAFTGAGSYWHNEGLFTFKGTQPGVVVNNGVNLTIGPSVPANITSK